MQRLWKLGAVCRSLWALPVLCLLWPAPPALGDGSVSTLQKVLARRVLRVGMSPGVVPFVAVGADAEDLKRMLGPEAPPVLHGADGREVCGFDVELADEAARYLGVRLEIVLVDRVTELLPGLREGRYDVVLSALTRTLERALTVTFSEPYFASGLQVLVRDPARFPTLDSLKRPDVRIGAIQGTTAEIFVHGHLKAARFVPAPSEAALFAGIATGAQGDGPARAHATDAVVVDYVTARDAAVRERLKVTLHPVEERRFTTEHFAFALRQGDGDWLRWLNLLLFEIRSSGAFHRLAARYNPWFRSER